MAISEVVERLKQELKGVKNLNIWHSISKHKVCLCVKTEDGSDKVVKIDENDEPDIDEIKKQLLN